MLTAHCISGMVNYTSNEPAKQGLVRSIKYKKVKYGEGDIKPE